MQGTIFHHKKSKNQFSSRKGMGKMCILVVDDEPIELETLKRGLRVKGYAIVEALSAEEALCILEEKKESIGMVITDYLMPDMNGIDLLKSIRARYGSLPVILATAYGSKQILTEAIKYGCSGFVEKPFTPEQLHLEIKRIAGSYHFGTS